MSLLFTQQSINTLKLHKVLFGSDLDQPISWDNAQIVASRLYDAGHGSVDKRIYGSDIYAIDLINEIFQYLIRQSIPLNPSDITRNTRTLLAGKIGSAPADRLMSNIMKMLPKSDADADQSSPFRPYLFALITWVNRQNPAYRPYYPLFLSPGLTETPEYNVMMDVVNTTLSAPQIGGKPKLSLTEFLRAPAIHEPDSIQRQLTWILEHWSDLIDHLKLKLLRALDFLSEEYKIRGDGPGPVNIPDFTRLKDIERFSTDADWMPNVILLAKNIFVWRVQLSRKYGRDIRLLYDIPDEELDSIADSGFTALWLIGFWQRSPASKRIKHLCGNPDAEASAYSLFEYNINDDIGGEKAMHHLKQRCIDRGIRLACDMVPNHTGIDSKWIRTHPEWFIQADRPPFPAYSFKGENLSYDPTVEIYLEDHYFSKNDASVVFKHVDRDTGKIRFIYHGNDGTSMPWNDTAQLNYLLPEVREAVIQTILSIARQFPIIRFDAAMTLTKLHFQRLWFPEAGSGSDIPSRSANGLTKEEFDDLFPEEFWRTVVDRVAAEVPDTLLLAEAFWMMEGYFVRTLGMHRVYNSAFMNMLKIEDNARYRQSIKNVLAFDPEILKRYVNFLNNPDEDSAAVQFGKGDKYFGVAALMAALPGTPLFGHGQIEGYHEKYGMEFSRPYRDEYPDAGFIERHQKEIFPLLRVRYLFSDSKHFRFFDFFRQDGTINENVFAFSNGFAEKRAIVVYNNAFEKTAGRLTQSVEISMKKHDAHTPARRYSILESLGISSADHGYLIMRVHPQGFTIIRSTHELMNEGFQVVLSGYEYQAIFIESILSDDEHNHLSTLHQYLVGAGISNLPLELIRIQYRYLHIHLSEMIQILKSLPGYPDREHLNDPALNIPNGLGVKLDAFWNGLSDRFQLNIPDLVRQSYRRSVNHLYKIFSIPPSFDEDISLQSRHPLYECFYIMLIGQVRDLIKEYPGGIDSLLLIFDLKQSRAVEQKDLVYLIPDRETLAVIQHSFEILRDSVPNPREILRVVSQILKENQARSLIHLHEFDGKYWFDKDAFNRVSKYICLVLISRCFIYQTKDTVKNEKAITSLPQMINSTLDQFKSIESMAEASGYNWELFLKNLNKPSSPHN